MLGLSVGRLGLLSIGTGLSRLLWLAIGCLGSGLTELLGLAVVLGLAERRLLGLAWHGLVVLPLLRILSDAVTSRR